MTSLSLCKLTAIALFAATQPLSPAQSAVSVKVAGATFPHPIYTKWFADFHRVNPSVDISYDAIGSEAGIRKLIARTVDFGASDSPRVLHELAPADEEKYLFFPTVVGAVVPIVNLPGYARDLKFTPETLAGIYLGKIKKWNDPALAASNRGLPDLDIVVVHRSDGSGTSYAWTDFLSKTNPAWKSEIGARLAPQWPTGRGAEGNDGVAKLVKEIGGSIGYVEFIYAFRHHLSFGAVQNQRGRFIAANLESIESAAAGAVMPGGTMNISAVNSSQPDAYPITCFTWFVVPSRLEDPAKRQAIKDFLAWMLASGQKQAAGLGYVALPDGVLTAGREMLSRLD